MRIYVIKYIDANGEKIERRETNIDWIGNFLATTNIKKLTIDIEAK